jgi:hypothetical protein
MRRLALGFMGSVVLLAAACGGKVVVDAAGNGGNGGSGGATVSSAAVSPVGVVSASSGGVTLCGQVCAAIEATGCIQEPNCVSECQDAYAGAGDCVSLLDVYSQCLINTPGLGCNGSFQCEDDAQSFADCLGGPTTCEDFACAGNPGAGCSCKGFCDDRELAVTCMPGDATDFCTCFENGVPVGKCGESQQSGLSCDAFSGCCGAVFFP